MKQKILDWLAKHFIYTTAWLWYLGVFKDERNPNVGKMMAAGAINVIHKRILNKIKLIYIFIFKHSTVITTVSTVLGIVLALITLYYGMKK